MSLGNLDIADRGQSGPLDLLVAVAELIARHTPVFHEEGGWDDGYYACGDCWARLTDAEARTHVSHQLWSAGYLRAP